MDIVKRKGIFVIFKITINWKFTRAIQKNNIFLLWRKSNIHLYLIIEIQCIIQSEKKIANKSLSNCWCV